MLTIAAFFSANRDFKLLLRQLPSIYAAAAAEERVVFLTSAVGGNLGGRIGEFVVR